MGVFCSKVSKLVEADRATWSGAHSLGIDDMLRIRQYKALWGYQGKAKLMWETITLMDETYKHFFIMVNGTRIEFGTGQLTQRQPVKISSAPEPQSAILVKEFDVTDEVQERFKEVSGATNYSIALRNSEHFARYVECGTWCSLQMSPGSELYEKFDKHLSRPERQKVNTLPAEIFKVETHFVRVPIYSDWTNKWQVKFEKQLQVLDDAFASNIIVLGPTGAGKSTIINMLFNQLVAKAKATPDSVTRQMTIYSGWHNALGFKNSKASTDQENWRMRVNVVDTVGFCDSVLAPEDVYNLIKQYVKSNMVYVSKVIVVTSCRIEGEHAKAIKNFMNWLKYKDFKDNFVFIYNKAEDFDEKEKTEAIRDMCRLLEASPQHTVHLETSHKQWREIPMAFTTGFPRRAKLPAVSDDLQRLYDGVLQFSEISANQCIEVDAKSGCTIA